jgi:hypothetical protein
MASKECTTEKTPRGEESDGSLLALFELARVAHSDDLEAHLAEHGETTGEHIIAGSVASAVGDYGREPRA